MTTTIPLPCDGEDMSVVAAQYPPLKSSLASWTAPTPTPTAYTGYPTPQSAMTSDQASTWPKRVNKACSSCRRDKIKCDGARPCAAACVKKHLADRCIEGCVPCRRMRARCDGSKPCERCSEMNLDCVDESTTPTSKPEPLKKPLQGIPRAKPTERAKLACVACRRDNKRCDDNRPCTRCQSRQEECIHVGRGPKIIKQRCKTCRKTNKKACYFPFFLHYICEGQRPCKHCIEVGEECNDVPRKGGGQGSRVKAACMNCRRDKIQCGIERPCPKCVSRGLECFDRTCSCAEKGSGHCAACRTQKSENTSQTSEKGQRSGGRTDLPETPTSSTSSMFEQDSVSFPRPLGSQHPYDYVPQNITPQPNSYPRSNGVHSVYSIQNAPGMNMHGLGGLSVVGMPMSASRFSSQPEFMPFFARPAAPFPHSEPHQIMSPGIGVGVGVNVYTPVSGSDQMSGRAHGPAPMPVSASITYTSQLQSYPRFDPQCHRSQHSVHPSFHTSAQQSEFDARQAHTFSHARSAY
ncbi:hypothetical protein DFH11DRAFT_1860021 [Phellopilus nigrolimitatus]|nr:hypothetical protein DFH11DRAFT_1860021 [Phellopilus nigrolimitatus]